MGDLGQPFYTGNRASLRRVMSEQRRMARLVGNVRAENGARVRMQNGRLVIGGVAAAAAQRPVGFGVAAIDNAAKTVSIYPGAVQSHYGFAAVPVISIDEATRKPSAASLTTVAVGGTSAAPHVIYAYGTLQPLAGVVSPVSVSLASYPGHTTNGWAIPLMVVYLSALGKVVIPLVMQTGLIDLGSWRAP